MTKFEKILSVACMVALGGLAFAAFGCACGGEAGGKVAGNASASDQVYPWATTSKPAAK
jgi:hypothetical protein